MIFNDIVNSYNKLDSILKELDEIYNIAFLLQRSSRSLLLSTINLTYANRTSSNYSNLSDIINKEVKVIKESMLQQNLLKLGKLIRTIEHESKDNIRFTATSNLIGSIEAFADSIYELINSNTSNFAENYIKLLDTSSEFIIMTDTIKHLISELNRFDVLLMNTPSDLTEDNIFSIRLYNENLSVQDINILMKSISSIYERSCTIFDIPVGEYPLQPVKIESGSLLEKVFGHEKILCFMRDLFNRTINFIYRNYTKEGKISTTGTKIDILKEEVELINLCEQYGIDTSIAKETLEHNLNIICNDILKVTTSSTKISVNNETYDLSKVIEAKMIENIPMSLAAATEDDEINTNSDM